MKNTQTGKWNILDAGIKQKWNRTAKGGVGGNKKKQLKDFLLRDGQRMPVSLNRKTTEAGFYW